MTKLVHGRSLKIEIAHAPPGRAREAARPSETYAIRSAITRVRARATEQAPGDDRVVAHDRDRARVVPRAHGHGQAGCLVPRVHGIVDRLPLLGGERRIYA